MKKTPTIIIKNKLKTFAIIGFFIFFTTGFFFAVGKTVQDTNTYFFLGFIISLLSGIGSYVYSDAIVLSLSKAVEAREELFPEYYEITRNLILSSGQPMPKLYVIADEAMNAFATGRNPKKSAVAVTTGLLQKLNKDEIEGVIAHELSHIKNYDVLLMSIVSITMGILVFVADAVGRSFLFGQRNEERNEKDAGNIFMTIVFIASLIFMPIVSTLIQMAISRKREFLADLSAAKLTRNPLGLASALVKISNDPHILKIASNATAHMFIANPFYKGQFVKRISTLFNTHPPVEERIRILEELSKN